MKHEKEILAIAALIAVKAALDMLIDVWIDGMNETWRMMGE